MGPWTHGLMGPWAQGPGAQGRTLGLGAGPLRFQENPQEKQHPKKTILWASEKVFWETVSKNGSLKIGRAQMGPGPKRTLGPMGPGPK